VTGRFVLDTDAVIDVLRGDGAVVTRLAGTSPDDIGVASMTVAELRYGALASRSPARNAKEVARFLQHVRILSFGRRAATLHARLRWELRAQPIGPNDLVIAATAAAAGAILVSSNAREFGRVPGLRVESWR
jgi:tRNA(fMet)-specific endonuclease VapC